MWKLKIYGCIGWNELCIGDVDSSFIDRKSWILLWISGNAVGGGVVLSLAPSSQAVPAVQVSDAELVPLWSSFVIRSKILGIIGAIHVRGVNKLRNQSSKFGITILHVVEWEKSTTRYKTTWLPFWYWRCKFQQQTIRRWARALGYTICLCSSGFFGRIDSSFFRPLHTVGPASQLI